MLAVTCASWANGSGDDGFGDPNEGKWTFTDDLYNFFIEDGLAVLTNANPSENGSASGGGAYKGIVSIPATIEYKGETIPVVGIQDYAFYNCPELTKVIIPSSIATIGECAFFKTPKLKEIEVDKENNYFFSNGGILFSKTNELIAVPAAKTFASSQYTLPTTVEKIGNFAFDGCINIKGITLPTSLKSIGNYAFNNCENLTTINIPKGLSSIGGYAFNNCYELDIDFVLPTNINTVPQGLFHYCMSLKSVKLHNTTANIENSAFAYCTALTSIKLPQSITEISPKAFYGAGLTSIEIPGSVEIISNAAFANTKLTSVKLNEGVKVIDQSAFSGLGTNLTEVSFPSSVTDINNYAFSKSYVKNFYIHSTSDETELGDRTPFQTSTGLKIHVFKGMANEFKNAKNWSNYKDYIVDDVEYNGTQNDVVTLIDGVDYTNSIDKNVKKVIYSRVYKNSNWQPLYLPFDMEYDDWKDNFEIAIVNNIHQYDDDDNGTIDRTLIEVLKVKDGKTLSAHTPCVIKALNPSTTAQEIEVSDVVLKKAETKTLDCSSVNTTFLFTGFYSMMSGSELVANNYYAMANGGYRATTLSDNLKAYRWGLQINSRNNAAGSKGISIDAAKISILCEEDGETTGVNTVETTGSDVVVGIYDLNGHKLNALTKGINLVKYADGSTKKVIK